jgi:site-specific recombinase XerD
MVGELLGIDKILTHHVARHTYATILINNGVNLSAVQKVLGHQNIRTTQLYAKMLNTTISKEVLNVFNKINNGK